MSKKASQDASSIIKSLPDLSDEDKAKAEALTAHLMSNLSKAADNKTDPKTRPAADTKSVERSDDNGHDLDDLRPVHVAKDKKGNDVRKGGMLVPTVKADGPSEDERVALFAPYINFFPKGDMDNFRIERWAMANERAANTLEGSLAYSKYAPWETAYYTAIAKANQGDQVSGADGGFLAPEQWSTQFIDQIYAAQALSRLPVTRMNMPTRVLHIPKLTTAVTVSYGSESAALSATTAGFNQLSFTARKQSIFVQVSNELIRDSNPSAAQIIINNAQRWAALDRDKQSLIGNGQAGAPYGLLNVGGIGVASGTLATPSAPLFNEFNTAIYNVENLNGSASVPVGQTVCTGILGAVQLKSEILNMKDTTNNRPVYDYGINYMRGAARVDGSSMLDGLFGVPTWVLTNVLGQAAGAKNIIFGDWQHLYIMLRQDVELLTSNVAGTAFQNDQTWIRMIARYDVGVAHPEAFYTYTNG
ncbi:MAG: hypothetical protein NVS9B11_22940 [Candidatus Dormibacteraceae bacterium]